MNNSDWTPKEDALLHEAHAKGRYPGDIQSTMRKRSLAAIAHRLVALKLWVRVGGTMKPGNKQK